MPTVCYEYFDLGAAACRGCKLRPACDEEGFRPRREEVPEEEDETSEPPAPKDENRRV